MGPAVERLIADTRERTRARLARRERRAHLAFSAAFLVVAVALAVLAPWSRELDAGLAIALTIAYAVVARVEFAAGAGIVVPTQLVFVPMLLLLPTPLVPLLVAVALRRLRPRRGDARPARRRAGGDRAGERVVRDRAGAGAGRGGRAAAVVGPRRLVRAGAGGAAERRRGPDGAAGAARAGPAGAGDRVGHAPRLPRRRPALPGRAARRGRRGLAAVGGPARAPDRGALRLVRPRAGGQDRRRARALPGLPRHGAPARRRHRGRRPVHGRAHQGRRRAHRAGGRARWAWTPRRPRRRVRRAAPRRGQDPHPGRRSSTSRGRSTTTSGSS